jgi:protein SCO1/2
MKVRILIPILSCLLPLAHLLAAQPLSDAALGQIRFEQKQNAQIALDLPFRDEEGKPVQLGQYFGEKPVVLVLGYYECPMLCTLVLNGLMESAADMKWSIGKEFDVIDVSINPRETPALAAAKKRSYVQRYGRPGSAQGWHFLTATENASRQLADEVGFRYAYDPASRQYAHPSGLVLLTHSGKVSGYLFGVAYAPKDLYESLQRASVNEVSLSLRQFILLCFHYNPITGKYSGVILLILRVLGIGTVLGLVGLVIVLVRRQDARTLAEPVQGKMPADPDIVAQVSKP